MLQVTLVDKLCMKSSVRVASWVHTHFVTLCGGRFAWRVSSLWPKTIVQWRLPIWCLTPAGTTLPEKVCDLWLCWHGARGWACRFGVDYHNIGSRQYPCTCELILTCGALKHCSGFLNHVDCNNQCELKDTIREFIFIFNLQSIILSSLRSYEIM